MFFCPQCGCTSISNGHKYLKTIDAWKRQYRCSDGHTFQTLEKAVESGKMHQGRPRAA